MLNRFIFFCLLGFLLFNSINTFAAELSVSVINATPVGIFPVGIGSMVVLKSDDKNLSGKALFLGKALRPDKSSSFEMYLNLTTSKVFYIDSSNLEKSNLKFQTVLDPYEQTGGTCTGYAIYHFLQQTNLSGFTGTNELANLLATEEKRTNLLVDAINEYYLTPTHRYSIKGIMNRYGAKFGFNCNTFKTDSYDKAKTKVLAQLALGSPVIFSFNTGPTMVNSPFPAELYYQPNPLMDGRLWIPRKIGERNSGGHSIVAAGSFIVKNKTFLVMIDSDWSEPRIWDMDSFLNKKTAIDEVEFISCK